MSAPACAIVGARVFDGGQFLAPGTTVLLAGDRVAGLLPPGADVPATAHRIEAAGLWLTPAFIDTHNHGDYHCREPDNDGLSMLAQGVGTIVVGNCGYSATPEGAPHPVLLPGPGACHAGLDAHRAGLAGGLALGVADLMGHGTLRRHVLGAARPATPAEVDRMAGLLDEFLAQGGLGLSVGLNYPEAAGYDAAEMVPLCRVLARHGRPLTCHIADQGGGILGSAGECIDWADAAGCAVLISHMRPISDRFDHLLDPLFALFESRTNARFDLYPYAAGFTTLAWLFSYLFGRQPGPGAGRLPAAEVEERARGVCIGGLADVRVLASGFPGAAGCDIAALAAAAGIAPGDMAQDILIADPATVCLYERESRPQVIDRIIEHPLCLIGSDGYLFGCRHDGPCHPRCHGAFAGFLQRYARTGRLAPEAALHRLTAGAATAFGLSDRGRIAPGLRADLALLDWPAVAEAEGGEGADRAARGVALTLVGGQAVFAAGRGTTGLRPGRRAEPGRPAYFAV